MRSLIPIVLVLCHVALTVGGFVACYVTARDLGHLPKHRLPYISDLGVHTPEKYVFRQVLNTATFTGICLIIARLSVVNALNDNSRHVTVAGIISCIVGVVATYSLSLVANFPECGNGDEGATDLGRTHTVGAGQLFFLGTVFIVLDGILTLVLKRRYRAFYCSSVGWHGWLRAAIAVLALGNAIVGAVEKGQATMKGEDVCVIDHGKINNSRSLHPTKSSTPTSNFHHNTSAVCEWLHGALFLLYFLTFAPEFFKYPVRLTASPYEDEWPLAIGDETDRPDGGETTPPPPARRSPDEHSPLL